MEAAWFAQLAGIWPNVCLVAVARRRFFAQPRPAGSNQLVNQPASFAQYCTGAESENCSTWHERYGSVDAEDAGKVRIGTFRELTFDTSPKDHARIREIFAKERTEPKVQHVSFSLSPGTVVPHSVHLTALPQTIVDIEPTWRGNEYFQVGDQIVIVDPQSMIIVGVLDA